MRVRLGVRYLPTLLQSESLSKLKVGKVVRVRVCCGFKVIINLVKVWSRGGIKVESLTVACACRALVSLKAVSLTRCTG